MANFLACLVFFAQTLHIVNIPCQCNFWMPLNHSHREFVLFIHMILGCGKDQCTWFDIEGKENKRETNDYLFVRAMYERKSQNRTHYTLQSKYFAYSSVSNCRAGWNKRAGWNFATKS